MRLFKYIIITLLVMAPLFSKAQAFEQDKFLTPSNEELTITFIKHASLLFEFKGKTIYIDPVSEYADFSKFEKADYIIITHEHYDHFDTKAIHDLTKSNTQIIANQNVIALLKKGSAMHYGEQKTLFEDVSIQAVEAYNTTAGHAQFHPKGRDNGYVFSFAGLTIYVAGDTEDIKEMAELKGKIDIAFLPVNQPYTMTVQQASKAIQMIEPPILYPYHYTDTKIEDIIHLLKDTKVQVRIRQMQ